MRILFAGTPLNAAQTLEALVQSGLDVVGVLTRVDAEIGRKRVLTPSPVAEVASRHGIKVFKHNRIDELAISEIKSVGADLGIVVAYGALLDQKALSCLPKGWINLHYSLLPQLRGAAPVQHAILEGFKTTGVTLFQLDEGMDTGDVLMQVPTVIEPRENSGDLLSRLSKLGISALLELVPSLAAGFHSKTQQNHELKSFAPKINREMARVNWSKTSKNIERLINGMNPEPMAWTTNHGETLRILAASEFESNGVEMGDLQTGECFLHSTHLLIKCGEDSILELQQLQPAGKQPMQAAAWFRGQQSKGQIVFE